ncbi:sporulation integral membrane protein YtvI [Alteribacillus iranensis]|uniref:Sporulation integral membrane protein YtvI n=1 Tax=Alteribacillus iranensis TaxID=930128 RepID=A0A1I2FAB8_9BACI|nr:sporulation integral membrane protein YtvI [Alteribacillus iranensis]SFF02404.1 sporulation integral membrane protein YtvI [Alteribacillus iranensis]
MKKETAWRILRFFMTVILIVIVIWASIFLFKLTYPFWIAAFFVWMLAPLSSFFRKKLKFPAGLAALTSLLLSLSVLSGIITGITFLVIGSIQRFADQAPGWIENALMELQHFMNNAILPFWQNVSGVAKDLSTDETFSDGMTQFSNQIGTTLSQFAERIADGLTQLVLGVPTFLVAFLFILLAIYFLGKDWERFKELGHKYLPLPIHEKLRAFHRAMWFRVFGYVRAQFILMSVTGVIVLIGLSLLRIDHAFTLAIIVGIAEFLPYLGTGTILLPWALYMLITGKMGLSISLAVLYGITMLIRQTIEPKVLSSSMNLNPIAVLVSLFAGLKLFGAVGLFLGPALLVIIVILMDIGVTRDVWTFIKYGFRDE